MGTVLAQLRQGSFTAGACVRHGAEHAWACGRILPLAARSGKGELVLSPRPSLLIAAWKHRNHGGTLCQHGLRHPPMHCLHRQRFACCKNQDHPLRQL